MKLYFKQRFFSWLDSYDIFNESDEVAYRVEGRISWGHKLVIYDAAGNEVGMVVQKILTFLPKFELYMNGEYIGRLEKELSLFHPRYNIDYNGWHVEGSVLEWEYEITDQNNNVVAEISKDVFHWTDQYVLDIRYAEDALGVLMFVLAIDAEKCSRN